MPEQKAECKFNDSALNFNVTKVRVIFESNRQLTSFQLLRVK